MAIRKVLACDGCGVEVDAEAFEGRWLTVQTFVSQDGPDLKQFQEMAMRAVTHGEPMPDIRTVSDFGEFCSLPCLANWASSQAGIREAEKEMQGDA